MRDSECNHTVSYIEKGANRVQTYTAHAADCPHCLRREIERLQAENKTMQSLHFAVGKCTREDVPASVYSAWEAPESYYQCELYQANTEVDRLQTKLTAADAIIARQRRVMEKWIKASKVIGEMAGWAADPGAAFLNRQVERFAAESPGIQDMLKHAVEAFGDDDID